MTRTPSPDSFRKLLRAYLKRHKLTPNAAAARLALVSHSSLYYWIKGERNPSETYRRILTPLLRPPAKEI